MYLSGSEVIQHFQPILVVHLITHPSLRIDVQNCHSFLGTQLTLHTLLLCCVDLWSLCLPISCPTEAQSKCLLELKLKRSRDDIVIPLMPTLWGYQLHQLLYLQLGLLLYQ